MSLIDRIDSVRVQPNSLALFGLGQAGVVIRGPEGAIYLDPYLTDNGGGGEPLERLFPPPVEPHEVDNASAVLITHEHIDHFDPQTLGPIGASSPGAHFVGPHTCDFGQAGIGPERVLRPKALEPIMIGTARVTPLPSAHTALEWSEKGYPYLGYVVEWNGVTLYHSGDTVIFDAEAKSNTPGLLELLKGWSIDVMFVPINGRDYFRTASGLVGNTDAREAAEMAEVLGVKLIIPTHYDLLAANGANPAHFVDILYRHYPERRHHLLRPGECYYYLRQDS